MRLTAIVSAILSGALAVLWMPPHEPARAGSPKEAHAAADKNGDGVIDRREFHGHMVDVFYFTDKNKDGGLTPSELGSVTPEAFGAADRNGDGKLQLEEFQNARARDYDAADKNGDGVLSVEESTGF